MVGDGAYCVVDLIKQLPDRVALMARCAKNRALYELPEKGDHKSRKYGAGGRARRRDGCARRRVSSTRS